MENRAPKPCLSAHTEIYSRWVCLSWEGILKVTQENIFLVWGREEFLNMKIKYQP